jgi:perosamine synthetase
MLKLKRYNTIGKKELQAAVKVIKTGKLSPFLGSWSTDRKVGNFFGGKEVQKLERNFQKYFKVKHAISLNSWTSGLIASVGAIDIEPGDEIITSPWTMCATATAILHWCAIPVFADIEKDTFNLCSKSVESKITKKTKAILVPEIFGHPADIDSLLKIKKKYNLKILSDNAQSINAKFKNRFSANFFDAGGYSLNYHKIIHCGEGGIVVTNDDQIANKVRLIRNHGEAVVEKKGDKNIKNIIGYNFRLGEIEAAIANEQLKKLSRLAKKRQELALRLTTGLFKLKNLKLPAIKDSYTHAFYTYGMQLENNYISKRDQIHNFLRKKGIPIYKNYGNIHLLPIFKKKIAYGKKNFPWSLNPHKNYKYSCPNSEFLNDYSYLGIPMCDYDFSNSDIDYIIKSFIQAWEVFS